MALTRCGLQGIALPVFIAASLLMPDSAAAQAPAQGAFTVTFSQVGANVVATGTGTINTTGLASAGTSSFGPSIQSGSFGFLLGATPTAAYTSYDVSVAGDPNFGTGFSLFSASTGSGDTAGFSNGGEILVPTGYVSGTTLNDTDTWNNTTLAALDLTVGTFTDTYSYFNPNLSAIRSGALTNGTVTVIVNGSTPVPEPASFVLFGSAVALLWTLRGRQA